MLQRLELKNYTLAKNLIVEFSEGFNIITGESGAGKSVIIGAIELLLGARAHIDVIRFGEQKASIEAEFCISTNDEMKNILKKYEFDLSDILIIRREISKNGQNRIFVNDTPSSKQVLAEITRSLIDLHGQHSHQHLLRESEHIHFLDQLLGDTTLVSTFGNTYKLLQNNLSKYYMLKKLQSESKERQEINIFQLNEIKVAQLSEEDEEALLKEEKQLTSAEEIIQSAHTAEQVLSTAEFPIIQGILELKRQFEYLAQFDSSYKDLLNELKATQAFLDEASFSVQKTRNTIEINPSRLGEIHERLFLYENMKRKYANTIQGILRYAEKIEAKLNNSDDDDIKILELETQIKNDISQLKKTGEMLSSARNVAKLNLEKLILDYFQRLGMKHAELDVRLIPVESKLRFADDIVTFTEDGFEKIEFWIRTNKGSDFLPLAKSASGGELSRIMLALKSIIAEKDNVSILVFDEIDAGISGQIASSVGAEMLKLARHHQIICITHSPQIAGKGKTHFSVSKVELFDSTETRIKKLNDSERILELSALISDGKATIESKKLAENLLKEKNG